MAAAESRSFKSEIFASGLVIAVGGVLLSFLRFLGRLLWLPLMRRLGYAPRLPKAIEVRDGVATDEPVLESLRSYPADAWIFRFSDGRVNGPWSLKVSGSCVNPKRALVSIDIYAPPPDAEYEVGYVEVKCDTIRVYRREWDGFRLSSLTTVRAEVLRSPFWKWIEPKYETNLRALERDRRSDREVDEERDGKLYEQAMLKL